MSALTEGVILLSFLLPKKSREIRREGRIPILAQKLARLTAHTGLKRGVALLVLPFLGIVAAFGIAPDTVTDTAPRTQIVEQLALPATTLSVAAGHRFLARGTCPPR